jgi:hypothetical protein
MITRYSTSKVKPILLTNGTVEHELKSEIRVYLLGVRIWKNIADETVDCSMESEGNSMDKSKSKSKNIGFIK